MKYCIVVIFSTLICFSCNRNKPTSESDAVRESEDVASEIAYWPGFGPEPPVFGSIFERHPEIADFLAMRFHQPEGAPRPSASHLGDFGVGNGRVFAEEGLTFPLNTLHGMVGPTYSRKARFYSDLSLFLGDGSGLDYDEEWIAIPRSVPAIVSVGRKDDVFLVAVDLAPMPEGDPRPVHSVIWRKIFVCNRGRTAKDGLSLLVKAALKQDVVGSSIVEGVADRKRIVFFLQDGAKSDERSLTLPLPSVEPGMVVEKDLIIATCAGNARPEDIRVSIYREDYDELLRETQAKYAEFEEAVRVETPDPVVNDLITGLKRTLWVQISAQGASSPLSRYTMTWTRDLSGVIRPLTFVGAHELAEKALKYYYAAAAQAGAIKNAFEADLDLDHIPEVDWASKETMSGRTAAEGPSHLPIMFSWLWSATGKLDCSLMPFLRYSLFAQQWNEKYLQPFSGDETFRAAMNVAFGLPIEFPHEQESWSLVSSVLLAAAATALARMEAACGFGDEEKEAEALAQAATQAVEHFRLADGCLAALISRKDGALSPPFEDTLLMGGWAGPPWTDQEKVLECLERRLKVEEGVYRSKLHKDYEGFAGLPITEGIFTGMLPGYTLRVLAAAGHPSAESAFNHLRRVLSHSGNIAEYMVADDNSALQFVYDPIGGAGDITARFRPWEGGIILDALLYYLTGFEPDAPRQRATLRPHLPNGWPTLYVRPLRVGQTLWDLEVSREVGTLRVSVFHKGGEPAELTLIIDLAGKYVPDVKQNGRSLSPSEIQSAEVFDHTVVTLPACHPTPEHPCEVIASFRSQ